MKPWKSSDPDPVIVHEDRSFNGATAMKPWKSILNRVWVLSIHSFNGATAMKPWKRRGNVGTDRAAKLLQWGHGDEAVEEVDLYEAPATGRKLQWGHGDEAVEERSDLESAVRDRQASMGPRR